jgi:hypothetical protein
MKNDAKDLRMRLMTFACYVPIGQGENRAFVEAVEKLYDMAALSGGGSPPTKKLIQPSEEMVDAVGTTRAYELTNGITFPPLRGRAELGEGSTQRSGGERRRLLWEAIQSLRSMTHNQGRIIPAAELDAAIKLVDQRIDEMLAARELPVVGRPAQPSWPHVSLIEYENYGREVWHSEDRYPMKRLPDVLAIEDGAVLRLYECTHCAAQAFIGLDANRYVVVRAALRVPDAQPEEAT